ncbi:MAG: hypothetical protein COA43_02820 [Robiginitomaculum sp.]|nr:MAG: hypothetical protein COA43_02820 [Robiginitomaculum sp.]
MNIFKISLLSGLGLFTLNFSGFAYAAHSANTNTDCIHKTQTTQNQNSQMLQRHEQGDKYLAMRDQIVLLLKADGYLTTANDKVEMDFVDDNILINGKPIINTQKTRYMSLLKSTLGTQNKTKRIIIQGNHLEIENTSWDEKNHTLYISDTHSTTSSH